MSDDSNTRIAKNTIFLTIRVIVVTLISLYTSRVILQQLGVSDFGIYNIVGGLVGLINFLTFAIGASMQRFICKELNTGDNQRVQSVYASCCWVAIVTIIISVVVLDTVGYWFVTSKLNIPANRADVAIIVLQFSILNICFEIFKHLFHSLIVSFEKMQFYAYVSIADAVLKLMVVFLLSVSTFDKLISFSALQSLMSFVILILSGLYCRLKFKNIHLSLKAKFSEFKSISIFSFWSSVSCASDVACVHGSNIIVNLFYGVVVNASVGVTNQVKNALYAFTRNIQVAANPQIYSHFSSGNLQEGKTLVFRISKFSFYIMLAFGLPILFNIRTILSIWLVEVPPYCAELVSCLLLFCGVDALNGPLWTALQGVGRIKYNQIIISFLTVLNLPIIYFLFYLGAAPQYLFIVQLCMLPIIIFTRLLFAKKYCDISYSEYFRNVVISIVTVSFISTILPTLLCFFAYNSGFVYLISSFVLSFISALVSIYYFGLDKVEKNMCNKKIKSLLNKVLKCS